MAKRAYKVGTQEGANYASAQTSALLEVGDKVELDLNDDQERALIAAGWLEPDKKKEK